MFGDLIFADLDEQRNRLGGFFVCLAYPTYIVICIYKILYTSTFFWIVTARQFVNIWKHISLPFLIYLYIFEIWRDIVAGVNRKYNFLIHSTATVFGAITHHAVCFLPTVTLFIKTYRINLGAKLLNLHFFQYTFYLNSALLFCVSYEKM